MQYLFTTPIISTESPLISSDVFFNNFNTYLSPVNWSDPISPITINFDYSRPLISTYESIDKLPEVKEKMVDYFFDLLRDKWLLDDINDILNYFKYKDGVVTMISDLSEYSKTNISKDNNKSAALKSDFITERVFGKHELKKALKYFIEETKSKWVDLVKNKHFLKKFLREYIEKMITKKLKK
jgi:hypothetical protein